MHFRILPWMQIIRQEQQNRCSRQPSATWEMALATFVTTGKLNFQILHLFCAVRYGENLGAGNHDEIDKRDWQCTGI